MLVNSHPFIVYMNTEILLLLFVAFLCAAEAAFSSAARRCVVEVNERITLSSTCDRCAYRLPSEKDVPQIMIFIASDEPTKSPLLTVASLCIAAGMRVIVVLFREVDSDKENTELVLEKKITSSIPCEIEPLLSFQHVIVEGINDSLSPYDSLDKAEVEYIALDGMLLATDVLPNVMVLEAANVGAQLIAEKHRIRSVLLAPDTMLNLVAEKTFPSSGLFDLIRRRKDSFFLADRFMKMNKLRQEYELSLLRSPADYFEKATVVLVNELAVPHNMLPLHAHFVGPLLPPCVPCRQEEDESATILVAAPRLNIADTRTLIRGISMTRADFAKFFEDTCHPDNPGCSIHPEMCAFGEKMANFRIVWQIKNDTVLPELLPTFLTEDSSPVLEILSTYYPTISAVISHCDSESYPLFALGHQPLQYLLCIPTSDGKLESPRLVREIQGGGVLPLESTAIASALVNLLTNRHDDFVMVKAAPESENRRHELINGGNVAMRIIETIATAPQNEAVETLRERVSERANPTSKSKADIVLLLVASSAWNILFVISLGYCLRLIYVTSDPGMTSQTKRFLRSPSVQAVFQYLEELDWALLFAEKFWWCDDSMIHNRIDRFLRRYEPEEIVAEASQPRPESKRETPGNNVRRKRHTRKR